MTVDDAPGELDLAVPGVTPTPTPTNPPPAPAPSPSSEPTPDTAPQPSAEPAPRRETERYGGYICVLCSGP